MPYNLCGHLDLRDTIKSFLSVSISVERVEMRVSFHATVRDAAGTSETEIEASTLAELMSSLEKRFGKKLRDMLVKDGKLRDDVVILVNGQNVSHSKGLETRLRPDDDIAIFPPVSGG